MGCISIVFPGRVSKEDMGSLVVELIEYILFMRGQIPFRLDEGKKYVKQLQTSNEIAGHKCPVEIYMDSPSAGAGRSVFAEHQQNLRLPMKSHQLKRAEQQLVQSVLNFDMYFQKLRSLLHCHEMCEVVLNFGQNFRMPKELFHIKLPGKCPYRDCGENRLPFEYCKRHLFKTLIGNHSLFNDLPPEVLAPISVMLLLTSDMAVADDMEQKPFYSVPVRKKCEIELTWKCRHTSYSMQTLPDCDMDAFAEHAANSLSLGDEASSSKSDLWVQLKPVLKGFRDTATQKYDIML